MRAKVAQLLAGITLTLFVSSQYGCSMLLEASNSDYTDTSVAQEHALRSHVIRYLGEPAVTYDYKGGRMDVFRVSAGGTDKRTKFARESLEFGFDAITLGAGEFILTPLALCNWNRKIDLIVTYSSEDTVQSVRCAHPDSDIDTLMKGPKEVADEREMSCPGPEGSQYAQYSQSAPFDGCSL
jgi:hypothetical protein